MTYDGGSSTTSKSVYIDGVKALTQSAGTTARPRCNDEFLPISMGVQKLLTARRTVERRFDGNGRRQYALGRTEGLNVTGYAVCLGGTAARG